MKLIFLLLAFSSVTAVAGTGPVTFNWFEYSGRDTAFATPLAPGQFRNPILAGFYPDPSICRVGSDYYLVNSSFAYFPGIPIFHSRDLVNWTQLGHVIDRPTQLDYSQSGVTRGLFAPTISYHAGVFYVLCTLIDHGGNFLVTATNPAGPWSDPVWLGFDGIDPSLYFADDGRTWLVNNGNPPDNKPLYPGHRAIWSQEFDPHTRQLVGPRSIIINGGVDLTKKPVWIEGPHLFQRNGWYYLCCAEGGTSTAHSQVIFRSHAPTGPFMPSEKNPILTQRDLDGAAPQAVTCTGHAELVPGPDGNWWSVFLGCRPFAGKYWTTGRETFLLPATWTDDGWPQILPPGQRVPYAVTAPKLPAKDDGVLTIGPVPSSLKSSTGNFTWRDDFGGVVLGHEWIMLRAPQETWWSLTGNPGGLRLMPRAESLSGKGNPSFLARRLQHSRFDATIELQPPDASGVSSGLVAFQNETHYYFMGVRRSAGGLTLFLECANGSAPKRLLSRTVAETPRLQFRITGEETKLTFSYSSGSGSWTTLAADVDVTPITVQAAGGGLHFTGAVLGLYARKDAE